MLYPVRVDNDFAKFLTVWEKLGYANLKTGWNVSDFFLKLKA